MRGADRFDEAEPVSVRRAIAYWVLFAFVGWAGVLGGLALLRELGFGRLP